MPQLAPEVEAAVDTSWCAGLLVWGAKGLGGTACFRAGLPASCLAQETLKEAVFIMAEGRAGDGGFKGVLTASDQRCSEPVLRARRREGAGGSPGSPQPRASFNW